MRLDFNVLWVEDQENAVRAQKNRIEYLLRKEAFRLKVEFAESIRQAKEYLESDIFGDHIDLVLMDYDLGPGPKGDEGLVEVRNEFPYKDIVFYSARGVELQSMVSAKGVQGIFCSTRNDLPNIVQGVFETLVKKVIDIDHSRGIVMGATSDIDQCVNQSLTAVFENDNDGFESEAKPHILKRVEEIENKLLEATKEVKSAQSIEEVFNRHIVFTSLDRLVLLRKILKNKGIHNEKQEQLKKYGAETAPKRNDLAHISVQTQGFSRKLFDRRGNEITSDKMKQLRLELLDHQDVFEALTEELSKGES